MPTPTPAEQHPPASRLPDPARFFPELLPVAGDLNKAVLGGPLPRTTVGLVQLRVGQMVGSTYLTARQTGLLRTAGESAERLDALVTWREAPYFSAPERAALALTEAVLTANPAGERVPEAVYAEAAAHYDEKELWALTLAIGQIFLFVPVALIAKPVPGRPPGKNYTG